MTTLRLATFVALGTLAALVGPASGQAFDLTWNTLDAGGAMSSVGGVFEVSGTIAQSDASSFAQPIVGGTFELIGGFWAAAGGCSCPGDVNDDCAVTLTDLTNLLSAFGCCSSDACYVDEVDVNHDGCVDLSDLALVLSTFGTTCQ